MDILWDLLISLTLLGGLSSLLDCGDSGGGSTDGIELIFEQFSIYSYLKKK